MPPAFLTVARISTLIFLPDQTTSEDEPGQLHMTCEIPMLLSRVVSAVGFTGLLMAVILGREPHPRATYIISARLHKIRGLHSVTPGMLPAVSRSRTQLRVPAHFI